MSILLRTLVVLLTAATSQLWAEPTVDLIEFVFNINGSGTAYGTYGSMPAALFNTSGFNTSTGLGSVVVTYKPGVAGNYFITGYFDHDIEEALNSSFNEFGSVLGAPGPGVTYQLDDPSSGSIFANATAATNALDNTNHVPTADLAPNACCNVSMALSRSVVLDADETALVTFTIGRTAPGGFALVQTDPSISVAGSNQLTSASLYLSSSLEIQGGGGGPGVPEPGTMSLLAIALLGGIGARRSRMKAQLRE
jgi:hypothetical protein